MMLPKAWSRVDIGALRLGIVPASGQASFMVIDYGKGAAVGEAATLAAAQRMLVRYATGQVEVMRRDVNTLREALALYQGLQGVRARAFGDGEKAMEDQL